MTHPLTFTPCSPTLLAGTSNGSSSTGTLNGTNDMLTVLAEHEHFSAHPSEVFLRLIFVPSVKTQHGDAQLTQVTGGEYSQQRGSAGLSAPIPVTPLSAANAHVVPGGICIPVQLTNLPGNMSSWLTQLRMHYNGNTLRFGESDYRLSSVCLAFHPKAPVTLPLPT